MQQKSEAHKYN